MEIQSLILKPVETDTNDNAVETIKKKNRPEYSVEIASGCDFAIRRKTSKADQLLVCLISQRQYYIKNMKNGDIVPLTGPLFSRFVADMEEPLPIDCSWMDQIHREKPFIDAYMTVMESNPELAQKGYIWMDNDKDRIKNFNTFSVDNMYKGDPHLLRWMMDYFNSIGINTREMLQDILITTYRYGKDSKEKSLCYNYPTLVLLRKTFGIEWAKEYIKAFMTVDLAEPISESDLRDILKMENGEPRTFKAETFIDYIVYDCCRQGKRRNPRYFYHQWEDALHMQEMLYGKIREKYPEALSTLHDQLSELVQLHKQEIDSKLWKQSAEVMQKYTWKPAGSKFQIMAPLKPDDMYDEAQQQQNCLASYVDRVTQGRCMIFFLRRSKESEQDKSLVTIELYPNGRIGQVYAKNNHTPDYECSEFVQRWADEKGLIYR